MTESDAASTPSDGDAGSPEQAEPAPAPDAGPDLAVQLSERTADLQRLQAEYLNYKRRVDRDRELIRMNASAAVLASLLPVLDDIGRADAHSELHGGFKAVADSLQQAVAAHGLEPFGTDGDAFDPTVHEALMHGYSAEVSEPTADKILQVGYRIGEKILRPARVSVVEPGGDEAEIPEATDSEVESVDAQSPQE